MDLGTITAQIAQAVADPAVQAVGGAAATGGSAPSITKFLTDLAKAAWGGRVDRHPPEWFPLACAASFGILAVALLAIAAGADLTRAPQIAAVLTGGLVGAGGGAVLLTATHEMARPKPPVVVAPRAGDVCPTCGHQAGTAGAVTLGQPPAPSPQPPPWMQHR